MKVIHEIDISGLGGDEASEKKVAAQIREACKTLGFFTIVNHGVSPDLLSQLRKRSNDFFKLTFQEKLQLAPQKWNPENSNVYRGYFPSSVNGKEGYDMGHPSFTPDHPLVGTPYHEVTQLPSEDALPGFKKFVEEYFNALMALGTRILRGFSLALDLPADYLNQQINHANSLSTFRLNYYPNNSKPVAVGDDGAQLCCEMHTDGGLLTILYQPEVGGLEVKVPETGKWEEIPPSNDAFVINTGLFMERWTNGLFYAAYHRVRFSPLERISVPFFFEPDAQTLMKALPSTTEPFKFETLNYEQHLTESNKRFTEYAR
eukprot:TRINITY_DN15820_c0_g1_i1.p1 TRINITY_DN15820_c0_g1~~TRINITY_DN15820_c0_g1_i1.p1  ORF type:complete len:317 (-),score=67.94 TRINITY_DN15820_c0_g1_i1:21-971(-)